MARPKHCKRCNKPKRPKGNKFKDKPGYCECGRPTVMTEDMIAKLKDAFSNALSDRQACAYVGIAASVLYNYQLANPKFKEQKERLKLMPDIQAKQTIVKSLKEINSAWKWAERRDPDLKPISKIEHESTVEIINNTDEITPEEKSAIELLRVARRKRIEQRAKEHISHEEKEI